MDYEILKASGIDWEKGVQRCMNDSGFYEKLLEMFLRDDSFQRGKRAFESGDYRALFACAHELKGACGNAGMDSLYAAVCPLVEYLRAGGTDTKEVEPLFSAMQAAYDVTRNGVEEALKK